MPLFVYMKALFITMIILNFLFSACQAEQETYSPDIDFYNEVISSMPREEVKENIEEKEVNLSDESKGVYVASKKEVFNKTGKSGVEFYFRAEDVFFQDLLYETQSKGYNISGKEVWVKIELITKEEVIFNINNKTLTAIEDEFEKLGEYEVFVSSIYCRNC
jgi:hypothetical protein